jgi:protein-ribulosamine 3-kinase
VPAQVRPGIHGDPGRAPVDGESPAVGRLNPSFRRALGVEAALPAAGGSSHSCYRATIHGEQRFLKVDDAGRADLFAAQADGLRALRAAGISAPAPLSHGIEAGQAYLLLEYLELRRRGDFAALGRMLATMHRHGAERFGWQRDNYIGTSLQMNGWSDDWSDFWLARRLTPQLTLAARNGFPLDIPAMAPLLAGHRPQPSLLHGDLWSGNVGFTQAGPVVFDPAVYYGDREADLAMTELFGGFPEMFYAAYDDSFPLAQGYAIRKHLYNLYHLLNHLNLFGRSYLAQVGATLRLLAEALQ